MRDSNLMLDIYYATIDNEGENQALAWLYDNIRHDISIRSYKRIEELLLYLIESQNDDCEVLVHVLNVCSLRQNYFDAWEDFVIHCGGIFVAKKGGRAGMILLNVIHEHKED
tara:strand:+ start:115 stop:450 length:336 start_codon:yes stop_codon:yes gene_type:complete